MPLAGPAWHHQRRQNLHNRTPPVQKNHRAVVRTEEEAEWENAQLIEDDSENGRSVLHDSSPDVETAEEELSKINYLIEISR
jgi:hypothetical protein